MFRQVCGAFMGLRPMPTCDGQLTRKSSRNHSNAWYGVKCCGAARGANNRTTGSRHVLFNTERTAVEEYWLTFRDEIIQNDFPKEALGMVGWQGAFATWFSSDIDCIHGNQLAALHTRGRSTLERQALTTSARTTKSRSCFETPSTERLTTRLGRFCIDVRCPNDRLNPPINHLKEHSTW